MKAAYQVATKLFLYVIVIICGPFIFLSILSDLTSYGLSLFGRINKYVRSSNILTFMNALRIMRYIYIIYQ